jgi:hypothetical protein
MNYFSKKSKYKFNINEEYIYNCNLYDEKIKEKINKKKEKCLDILSTDEGDDDDSDDKLSSKKKYFPKTREKSYSLHYRNRQSSMIISSKGILKNKKSELKINNLKSTKVISSIYRKFGEKKMSNFKKVSQGTAASNAKVVSNYKKSIDNINQIRKSSHNNLIKSFSISIKNNPSRNLQVNKDNENTDKDKIIKSKDKNIEEKNIEANNQENDSKNENIQINEINKNIEDDKPEKIYKYNSSKKIRNHLPHIISPQKLNYLNNQQFSLNDIENYNIVPIVLPHIGKIKKEKKIKAETSKTIIKMKKMKNEK